MRRGNLRDGAASRDAVCRSEEQGRAGHAVAAQDAEAEAAHRSTPFGPVRGVRRAQNRAGMNQLIVRDDDRLPDEARLAALVDLLGWQRIAELEKALRKWHYNSKVSPRLEKIPGVGAATALTASLGDGKQFRKGRQFSASLVPRQDGTGGAAREDLEASYLRSSHGARSVLAPPKGRTRLAAGARGL